MTFKTEKNPAKSIMTYKHLKVSRIAYLTKKNSRALLHETFARIVCL